MAKPLTRWRKTRRRNTTLFVGRFFELLTLSIMKGKNLNVCDEDLVIRQIEAGVEVKASDNNNSFRVRVDQLSRHSHNATGFPAPFDLFFYCLFCYRNKSSGKKTPRCSLLSACADEMAVYSVLAQNTDTLYVLDHRILLAHQQRHGSVSGKFPQKDIEVIEFRRSLLKGFSELNAPNILSFLGLNPGEWVIRERSVVLGLQLGLSEWHTVEVKVVEVVPSVILSSLNHVLRLPTAGPSRRKLTIQPLKFVAVV